MILRSGGANPDRDILHRPNPVREIWIKESRTKESCRVMSEKKNANEQPRLVGHDVGDILFRPDI